MPDLVMRVTQFDNGNATLLQTYEGNFSAEEFFTSFWQSRHLFFHRTDKNVPQRYGLYQLPVHLWVTVILSVAMENAGVTRAQTTMSVSTRQMIVGQPAKDGAIWETEN